MLTVISVLILAQDWTGPGGPPVRHNSPNQPNAAGKAQPEATPPSRLPLEPTSTGATSTSEDESLASENLVVNDEELKPILPDELELPKFKLPKIDFPKLQWPKLNLFDTDSEAKSPENVDSTFDWDFGVSYCRVSGDMPSVSGTRFSLRKRTQSRFDYEFECRVLNDSDFAVLGSVCAPIGPELQIAGSSVVFDLKAGIGYQQTSFDTWWGGTSTNSDLIGSIGVDASLPISNKYELFIGARFEDDFELEFEQNAVFFGGRVYF